MYSHLSKKALEDFIAKVKKCNFKYYDLNNNKEYSREKSRVLEVEEIVKKNPGFSDALDAWKKFADKQITQFECNSKLREMVGSAT